MKPALYRGAAAVLLGVASIVATMPVHPVSGQSRGDPLPASIENPTFQNFDGSGSRGATGFDEQQVAERLTEALVSAANGLFSGRPGWECLRAARLKQPWKVIVNTTVWTAPVPSSVWSVATSVLVNPGPSIPSGRNRRTPPPGGSVLFVAADQLREIIDELDGQGVKPCKFKPKIRGKAKLHQQTFNWERTYSGEADLALRADGSFQGMMTIPDSWVHTVSVTGISCRTTESGGSCTHTTPTGAQVVCTFTAQPGAIRVEFAGQYRAQDTRLLIERMNGTAEQGGTTGSCPGVPGLASVTTPPSSGAGDFLAGSRGLEVALADGAEVALPRPAGFPGDWDVKLQIEYPGGARATGRSPVQAARAATLVGKSAR